MLLCNLRTDIVTNLDLNQLCEFIAQLGRVENMLVIKKSGSQNVSEVTKFNSLNATKWTALLEIQDGKPVGIQFQGLSIIVFHLKVHLRPVGE
jgi:hypothetical protein